jgi:predicted transcriptional regulator|tara:strand:+ start:741 stop:1748 length:1008 start_codon:yes stop_codon:yes gene_type:complete
MFILGFTVIVNVNMNPIIPDISRQIYKEDILKVLERKYSLMGPMWVNQQCEWMNGIYASFKNHDKFLILIFLVKKTLDFYSRNFTKVTYEEFYSKDIVQIERFSIAEISEALCIPKESARRKILELEEVTAIRKIKNKIIIDRSKFYFTKPQNSIKRISRFLTTLSDISENENFLSDSITSEELELIIKDNFSYVWKLYYELQIPMMIRYKEVFGDIESFHIFGICVLNEHLHAKKVTEHDMHRDEFLNSFFSSENSQGINAMSISDITGIPRATVIRKLKNLVKQKKLRIDIKKHYKLTMSFAKILKPIQRNILVKLANFSAKVYNLELIERKN